MHGKGEDGAKVAVGDALVSREISVVETGELLLGCCGICWWNECQNDGVDVWDVWTVVAPVAVAVAATLLVVAPP